MTSKTGLDLPINLGNDRQHSVVISPSVYWNLSKTDKIQFNKHNAQLVLVTFIISKHQTEQIVSRHLTLIHTKINDLRKENDYLKNNPKIIEKEIVKEVAKTQSIGDMTVNFAQNSSVLTDVAKQKLSTIPSGTRVSVIGSASPEGTKEYNQKLSEERAKVVADFLKSNNVIVENAIGIGTDCAESVEPLLLQLSKIQ